MKSSQKPNFLFCLADDQDQLDCRVHSNSRVQTATLDNLALEGMLFTNDNTIQSFCVSYRIW
ncbi:hypothetical protein [Urechidicola sp. KH5]